MVHLFGTKKKQLAMIAKQIICFFHQNIALGDTSNKFGTDIP